MFLKFAILLLLISILNVDAKTKDQRTKEIDVSEIKVHCACDKEKNEWIVSERLSKECMNKLAKKHKTIRL